MKHSLTHCPICSDTLMVSRYTCRQCRTEISGEFEMPEDRWPLDQELIDFIKVFIYAEGSIKQSEKLLNCSYPKVKNLLKKTKIALGVEDQVGPKGKSVIERLDKGEIDVEEALEQLKRKG